MKPAPPGLSAPTITVTNGIVLTNGVAQLRFTSTHEAALFLVLRLGYRLTDRSALTFRRPEQDAK